jgi:hypothetical protein
MSERTFRPCGERFSNIEVQMMTHKDARSKSISRKELGEQNRSVVYEVFQDNSKMTVSDVYEAVRARQKEKGERPLNERTIRRAIDGLHKYGFLVTVGRRENAILYAKQSSVTTASNKHLVSLGGNLVTVPEFLKTFADLEIDPFKIKVHTLSHEAAQNIRKRLLFTIISAGEPGFNEQLKMTSKDLHAYLAEVEHIANVLKTFLDSPVWYQQYRDRIAYEVRRTQQEDPELYQLAFDAIKGG